MSATAFVSLKLSVTDLNLVLAQLREREAQLENVARDRDNQASAGWRREARATATRLHGIIEEIER